MVKMKIAKIVFLVTSVLLAFLLMWSIINTRVSLKYEIDEVRCFGETVHIDLARGYILQIISTLRVFLFYVLTTVVYLSISFIKDRSSKKDS